MVGSAPRQFGGQNDHKQLKMKQVKALYETKSRKKEKEKQGTRLC